MTEKDKSTVLLEHYLKKLKLPTMLRKYTAVATVCQKDRSDFPIYLLRLAERELLGSRKFGPARPAPEPGPAPVNRNDQVSDAPGTPNIVLITR